MAAQGERPVDAAGAHTIRLLVCGLIAGPLFTVAWIIEGATRADYSPVRHPISSLALGDLGWTQTANFIITGVLTLAFAVGLWRVLASPGRSRWGPLLVGVYAIGLIGAGVFVTDPVSGYPPGTSDRLVAYSTTGALHDLFSVLVFAGLPAACFVFARYFARDGQRGWAVSTMLTGVVFLLGFVLSSLAFGQVEGLVAFGGVLQRVTLTIGWTWLTLLAVRALRAPRVSRRRVR